ncbi:Vegetative incompatibility protein HET-E-1 [Fusarium oxysporum f. sp. albedinis]|nr:Vegetative incompatibility protein HET-E-1 [Fusarium oxysporum f. sp. albedinis]
MLSKWSESSSPWSLEPVRSYYNHVPKVWKSWLWNEVAHELRHVLFCFFRVNLTSAWFFPDLRRGLVLQAFKKSSISPGIRSGTAPRGAARWEGIATSTLKGRIEGSANNRIANEKNQSLTAVQEKDLVIWILLQERGHQPPTKQGIYDFAEVVASLSGQGNHLGKNLVNGFFSSRPSVQVKPSRLISASWKKAITP